MLYRNEVWTYFFQLVENDFNCSPDCAHDTSNIFNLLGDEGDEEKKGGGQDIGQQQEQQKQGRRSHQVSCRKLQRKIAVLVREANFSNFKTFVQLPQFSREPMWGSCCVSAFP